MNTKDIIKSEHQIINEDSLWENISKFFSNKLTILSKRDVWGMNYPIVIDIFSKGLEYCGITDFAIATGASIEDPSIYLDSNIRGSIWTKSFEIINNNPRVNINVGGKHNTAWPWSQDCAVRPVITGVRELKRLGLIKENAKDEIEFGEYPQTSVEITKEIDLEEAYKSGKITKTNRRYTVYDSTTNDKYPKVKRYVEMEYEGNKYIRVNFKNCSTVNTSLSNNRIYNDDDKVWIKIEPIKWIIDEEKDIMICEKGLVSGVRFMPKGVTYNGDFSETEIGKFLNKYMAREMFYDEFKYKIEKLDNHICSKVKKNPFKLNLEQVTEEDIIRGAIESNISVFLHGPSSEGKSARVKQIDPNCEIIYLRNASPESLNGKSVYNQTTGKMIDIKPTWLENLEEKCKNEPDKNHILFFDEITNALPSIQGIAFNIVLDKEVNGKWKLPDNVRIVAAGNDMKDSLAANQLAEPLFNRFAHVYIETTTDKWLKWASENNIHPAIYSYIAYKNGDTLRSEYNGEKPNADPRKWEMASKMLYATGKPAMLRSLVGEEITTEFMEFCNQEVITLDDVLNDNYQEEDIQTLNTAQRYATTMGLSQVDEDNIEKVRGFVETMGQEYKAVFDSLWTHNDESRLEKIAELKLEEKIKRRVK